jgi:hypothetical protein
MKNISNIVVKITTIVFLLSFSGCPIGEPTGDSTVTIINNSDKSIYFYFDSLNTLVSYNPFIDINIILKPNSNFKHHSFWFEKFETAYDIHLFLFDKEVIKSVPWDTIRTYNMYLKRIDFTKATLDSLNWTLTYP